MKQLSTIQIITVALLLSYASTYAQPHIVAEPDSLAALFDYVGPDGLEWAENFFLHLRNEGDADLFIEEVHCNVEHLRIQRYDQLISPGASINLPFVLDGRPEPNHFEGTVSVLSNDPDNEELIIPATLDVLRSRRIFSLRDFYELDMYSGEIRSFNLVLSHNVEEQIGYRGEANYEFVEINPREGVVGDTVMVTVNASNLRGDDYEIELTFHADREDVLPGIFLVFLNVTIVGDIDVVWPEEFGFPDMIDINVEEQHGPASFPIQFFNIGSEDLEVIRISFENRYFSVDVDNFVLGPEERRTLELVYSADTSGLFEDALLIESSAPDESELRIPIRLEVGLSVSNEQVLTPCMLNLDPPYPNPFNSTVTISYSVGQVSEPARLGIYDLSGRMVADLLEKHPPFSSPPASRGGKQTVVWDAGGMAAGVYFVRLEADRKRQTQKIILIR